MDPLRRQAETGKSHWHCAVGKIIYSEVDSKAPDGTLVYLKASLTGDEPEDLLNYATRCPSFPHESTANQWFGESQFESYRMLGYHEARELLSAANVEEGAGELNAESLFVALRRAWHPPSAVSSVAARRAGTRLPSRPG